MTYAEKLRHPYWQKKRLEVMHRDEFKCQLCGDEQTEMHVHHKSYERGKEPWEYELDNFISYCKYCHKIVESCKKDGITPIEAVKWKNSLFLVSGNIQSVSVAGAYFIPENENDAEMLSVFSREKLLKLISMIDKIDSNG